jgi:aspartyl-tRNA(Asn)/glutamyl-tRNA(Gln) amidotransferase subunit A
MDQAKTAETEISNGRYRGRMHGIPIGLKDIYNTAGIRTTGHSRVAMDNVPTENATTVKRLYDAGAVLLGKLATHEFAHGGPSFDLPWPPARNPWHRDHFTGGSSSGSAASVAAGLVLGALGSDTGGSIRMPASMCGIVGLKPTYGLISRYGVIPNSYTFDHCGPMTWTVEDCAIMLQVLAGYDPKDPAIANQAIPDYSQALIPDLHGIRIGALRHFWERDCPVTDEVSKAMDDSLKTLHRLGAEIQDVNMHHPQDYFDVKMIIAESEIFAVHQNDLIKRPGDFGLDFLARCLPACFFSGADYVQAQRRRRQLIDEMAPIYKKCDILLTAGEGPAPRYDGCPSEMFRHKANFSTVFNVTGGPALSICNGFTRGGLPLSMQIIGRPFDEMTVLRAAYAFEQATPWRGKRPDLQEKTPFEPLRKGPPPPQVDIPTEILRIVESTANREGLILPDNMFRLLCEGAAPALKMSARMRIGFSWSDEPSNSFHFTNRNPGVPAVGNNP